MREEELKNTIAKEYFYLYDCTKIIGNVDFCVCMHQSQKALFDQESLLWAEAKTGSSDIYKSIVQLILTIGKARTFDKFLPPAMLGAFDGEKIAFIPYSEIHDIFYLNDFNWNVASSNYETKEFKFVHDKVKSIIDNKALLFHFESDEKDITRFIKNNFIVGKFGLTKTRIDKNNFIVVYNKWLNSVKKTIAVNWEIAKKNGLIDGDFYLADLISDENTSLKDNLYVVLKATRYEFHRFIDQYGAFTSSSVEFNDKQVAHTQFWNKYERPPKEEYWDYIIERRDLLVPQDVRERKGSFFTPQIWVELSQKYLTDVLGEDWQDEYYVWDCAAGTGNLLTGLTNKYNIWASTLDEQDVEVMKDRIKNGANLLEEHVFQFDFLNDELTKLPKPLQEIINNPKKRKKLVIYINPPYAEAGNKRIITGVGENKSNVSSETLIYRDFNKIAGTATRELFAQFFLRVYKDIPNSVLAQFSTLKFIQSQNFLKFRNFFKAEFRNGFVVPASSFDNVKGHFPIGFFIWNLNEKKEIKTIQSDVYQIDCFLGKKTIHSYEKGFFIIDWLRKFYDKNSPVTGFLRVNGPDIQNNLGVFLTNSPSQNDIYKHFIFKITQKNILEMSIYYSVRLCIEANWLNDRDQFTYPNDGWQSDNEFQNDCLTFALFHGQNRISSKEGTNHWIPFTEYEVGAREKFDSNFMVKFIEGTHMKTSLSEPRIFYGDKRDYTEERNTPLEFSSEAKTVFNAGRELWKYYHAQPNCNVNASLYDIREHFQGRNPAGKMNNKSDDAQYMSLIGDLRNKLKILAKKIEPKVYEYGFLKQ